MSKYNNITTTQWVFLIDLCEFESVGHTISSKFYSADKVQELIDCGLIILDGSVYRPTQLGRKESVKR